MTANEMQFFEDDDDFFADAFRSISELESSPKHAVAEESSQNGCKNKTDLQISKCDSPLDVPSSPATICLNDKVVSASDSAIQHETTTRFTPGVPPKRKKRKFCGPAGLFTDEELEALYSRHNSDAKRLSTEEKDCEDISSSQISAEELYKTSSWQKLQEHVSSNSSLLSIAECFSIQRVRSEALKKSLPKHIIVPILCVYIKKCDPEESIFEFMDDTEEINGSISKEILELYRHCFKSGTSLILKKVTFICNVMIVGKSNLVSLFLEDGSVQHEQDWTVEEEYDELSRQALLPSRTVCPDTPRNLKNKEIRSTPLSIQSIVNKNLSNSHSFSSSPSSEDVNKNNHRNLTCNTSFGRNPISQTEAIDDFDDLLETMNEESFLEEF